jgi:hypothetical protein
VDGFPAVKSHQLKNAYGARYWTAQAPGPSHAANVAARNPAHATVENAHFTRSSAA